MERTLPHGEASTQQSPANSLSLAGDGFGGTNTKSFFSPLSQGFLCRVQGHPPKNTMIKSSWHSTVRRKHFQSGPPWTEQTPVALPCTPGGAIPAATEKPVTKMKTTQAGQRNEEAQGRRCRYLLETVTSSRGVLCVYARTTSLATTLDGRHKSTQETRTMSGGTPMKSSSSGPFSLDRTLALSSASQVLEGKYTSAIHRPHCSRVQRGSLRTVPGAKLTNAMIIRCPWHAQNCMRKANVLGLCQSRLQFMHRHGILRSSGQAPSQATREYDPVGPSDRRPVSRCKRLSDLTTLPHHEPPAHPQIEIHTCFLWSAGIARLTVRLYSCALKSLLHHCQVIAQRGRYDSKQ